MSNEELVKQISETGDQDNKLALQLWEMNSGIIRTACNKFSGYIEFEDALQECYEPFMKAIKEYDPATGMKFMTYCYNRCTWHLQRYIEKCGLLIRIPSGQRALIRQYRKLCRMYYQEHGERPADYYLCKELDISQDQLDQLRKDEGKTNVTSLNEPLSDDPEGGTVADLVPDDSRDIEEEALEVMYKDQRARAVWGAVDTLKPQDGQAIRFYYKDGKTYAEAGKVMGVTAERVRACVVHGLRTLRTGRQYRALRNFVDMTPLYSIGIRGTNFNRTWTSPTERAAFRIMDMEERWKREREELEQMLESNRRKLQAYYNGDTGRANRSVSID